MNKKISKINKDTKESERVKLLKTSTITIFQARNYSLISNEQIKEYEVKKKNILRKELRVYATNNSIYKRYENIGDIGLSAYFSGNGLDESSSKSRIVYGLFYVIDNIKLVLDNSIKIEEHADIKNDNNIKSIYELLSLLYIQDLGILVIKITVKEMNSTNVDNTLYTVSCLQIIKKITSNLLSTSKSDDLDAQSGSRLSTIKLTHLFRLVNNSDILRYIPDELLTETQRLSKRLAKIEYNYKKLYQIIKQKEN